MDITGRTVLIAGLGVSGTSLAEVLRESGAKVIGVDERKPDADLDSFDKVDWDGIDYVMSSRCSTRAPRSSSRRSAAASPC